MRTRLISILALFGVAIIIAACNQTTPKNPPATSAADVAAEQEANTGVVTTDGSAAASNIAERLAGRSFEGWMRWQGYNYKVKLTFLPGGQYRATDFQWESWRGTWRTDGDAICIESAYDGGCYPATLNGERLTLNGSSYSNLTAS